MKQFKTVVVGIKLGGENEAHILEHLREAAFLTHSDLHFVHVVKNTNYALSSGSNLGWCPSPDSKVVIEHEVRTKLTDLMTKLRPLGFEGKLSCQCVFAANTKKGFTDYARDVGAELIILPAGEGMGRFGSFIQHQLTHTHVPTLILKARA